MRLLNRYLAAEILPLFFLGLFILSFLLVASRMFQLFDWLLRASAGWRSVAVLVLTLLPSLAAYLVPVAFLVAILFAFGRLSADSEIVALGASGIGIRSFLIGLFPMTLALFAAMAYISLWGQPAALRQAKSMLSEIVEQGFDRLFQPGTYIDQLGGATLYFEKAGTVDPDFVQPNVRAFGMEKILLVPRGSEENGEKAIATANRGALRVDPERMRVWMALESGEIHREFPDRALADPQRKVSAYERIGFDHLELELDLAIRGMRNIFDRLRPPEMTLAQLYDLSGDLDADEIYDRKIELGRRFSFPLAVFVFLLAGVPLGISFHRFGKAGGFGVAGALALTYYLMIMAAGLLVRRTGMNTLIAHNLANLLLGGLGVWLAVRKEKEG